MGKDTTIWHGSCNNCWWRFSLREIMDLFGFQEALGKRKRNNEKMHFNCQNRFILSIKMQIGKGDPNQSQSNFNLR